MLRLGKTYTCSLSSQYNLTPYCSDQGSSVKGLMLSAGTPTELFNECLHDGLKSCSTVTEYLTLLSRVRGFDSRLVITSLHLLSTASFSWSTNVRIPYFYVCLTDVPARIVLNRTPYATAWDSNQSVGLLQLGAFLRTLY